MKSISAMLGLPESATSEEKAIEFLEQTRWSNGTVCPHCKNVGAYKITGKSVRKGLWKCKKCRKQFTVRVGTIFEDSHIPLHKWLMAIHFLCASKKGMSAHQLHRMLDITYKSAWFMAHRIRYAMKQPPLVKKLRGHVEVDETYVGSPTRNRPRYIFEGAPKKPIVMALVSRKGEARAFPIKAATAHELKSAIRENVDKRSTLFTDEWKAYGGIGKDYQGHETVVHSRLEYVRGRAHTNTAESFFSLLKRGVRGTFHHISKQHLGKYCDEFAFRWNHRNISDMERGIEAIKQTEGKRLMYNDPIE